MCWGLNSHLFPVSGDGHQPNSRVLSLVKVGVIELQNFCGSVGLSN